MTDPQPMYPRTAWVHAARRWFDGEIGPDGEQLTIPGMPEPPSVTAQRTFWLVAADYATPDGFLTASTAGLQRRWLIKPQTARTYWRLMRATGWMVPLGDAHRGRVQRRELTIPSWARLPEERRSPQTPLSGERRSPESERRSPGTPPEGVRRNEVQEGGLRASAQTRESTDGTPPPACTRHPNGWHHNEPCQACGAARRYAEGRRVDPADRPVERCPHGRIGIMCGDCIAGHIGVVEAVFGTAGKMPT